MGVEVEKTVLTHHTQVTFVAPTPLNKSCTCRHIFTYWLAVLPLTPAHHGYQFPFISWASRRKKGWPQFLAAVAQLAIYGSYTPFMIFAKVNDCVVPKLLFCGCQLSNGIAP